MRRPEVKTRLLELVVKEDYLLLVTLDYCRAKFAWAGMGDEKKNTEQEMQSHFDALELRMENYPGVMMWNATVPGRITGEEPGLNEIRERGF